MHNVDIDAVSFHWESVSKSYKHFEVIFILLNTTDVILGFSNEKLSSY